MEGITMDGDAAGRLLEVWRSAHQKRKLIGTLILVAGLAGTVVALALPARYTAEASFFPEARTGSELTTGLGTLAGLVGAVGGPLGLGPSSSQFFTDLFKSRSFLDSLAASSIEIDTSARVVKVAEYLVPGAPSAAYRRWKARRVLRKAF